MLNYYQIIFVCNYTWKRYLAIVWKRESTPKTLLCSFSLNGHVTVGRNTNCKSWILLKTQQHLFSVDELCSLHDFKYMRQRQKSQENNKMRPPKWAPITMTKVAKSYKNSSTKWLFCHSILSHTSPSSICCSHTLCFYWLVNLFRPHVNCMKAKWMAVLLYLALHLCPEIPQCIYNRSQCKMYHTFFWTKLKTKNIKNIRHQWEVFKKLMICGI